MSLYAHKVGEVGVRFECVVKAPSPTGILEDISLAGAKTDGTGFELEFMRPSGRIEAVRAKKESDSNTLYWVSEEGFLDEVGTWRLSANVRYQDETYVKGARGDLFTVVA